MQPAGRTWDYFHQVLLHRVGAIVILGTLDRRSPPPISSSDVCGSTAGRSGRKFPRFKAFERFAHWLTAVSFVILAITGLNITFGKIVLLPVIGPEAFSPILAACKYHHNFMSFAFMLGAPADHRDLLEGQLPAKVDLDWVRQGGGFIKNEACPGRAVSIRERSWSFGSRLPPALRFPLSGSPAAVSLLRNRHCRHADRAGRARHRRRSVHRPDPRPHLYRHARHGGRLRGHGHRPRSISTGRRNITISGLTTRSSPKDKPASLQKVDL